MVASISSRHPPHHVLLRGRETKLRSRRSERRGSPLQLSYFLAEVIQLFDACQLGRPRGAGAVLGRDMETDVKGGQEDGRRHEEEQSPGRWEDGWRRLTTAGRKGMKCWQIELRAKLRILQRGQFVQKKGGSRGDGHDAEKHALQICLTEQKTQEGNSNIWHSYRGRRGHWGGGLRNV